METMENRTYLEKNTLLNAQHYEAQMEQDITQEERPLFHLSSRVGWMNDPNGFSYYKGQYHMFYQYHPYDAQWGPMHWGHAVSADLLHWEYLPAALAPDQPYDCNGCFSGNALELPDGRQLLMYTGVKLHEEHGRQRDLQTQCLAIGDGKSYEKYAKNPVLSEKDLPEGASPHDFRDPKLWRKADGTYCCIIGSRTIPETKTEEGSGQILLFTSPDAFHWEFKKVLDANKDRYGKMWECPDFFELNETQVLLVSPQDMLPQGFEYHNGNGTLCLMGSYDDASDTFIEKANQAVDYGIDFYAPQTVLTPDGRRVMIGWMQNWDTSSQHPKEQKWFGQMSLPRELFLRNGRLCQRPVRELERYRRNEVCYRDVTVSGELRLNRLNGRMVDLELEIEPADPQKLYQKFALRFAQGSAGSNPCQTSVSFRPYESVVKLDRKFSGSRRAVIHQRRCKIEGASDGKLRMRVILDRFSAEVFFNDGDYVMTATFYTGQEADGISFFADGDVKMNVIKYDLK